MKGMNVNEEKLWDGFGKSVDQIKISEEWAKQISEALNKTHQKIRTARIMDIENYRQALLGLEGHEDTTYQHFRDGVLDEAGYKRQIQKIREERHYFTDLMEKAHLDLDGAYLETAESILELATNAKLLWLSRSARERRDFLDKILSNPKLEGTNVRYTLRKPFLVIAKMTENGEWRPQRESNPRYRRERAVS